MLRLAISLDLIDLYKRLRLAAAAEAHPALVSPPTMSTNLRPLALFAQASSLLVPADLRPPAISALTPPAQMSADPRPSTVYALMPLPAVGTDLRALAFLAPDLLAVVLAEVVIVFLLPFALLRLFTPQHPTRFKQAHLIVQVTDPILSSSSSLPSSCLPPVSFLPPSFLQTYLPSRSPWLLHSLPHKNLSHLAGIFFHEKKKGHQ